MSISAGDIRATMTLDTSQFTSGMASARTELTAIEADGSRVTKAFAQLEARTGASASAMAAQLQSAGTSSAGLMEALGRADGAAVKVEMLSGKAAQAAQALTSAQSAAQQSADKLALLEESAQASAENLQAARAELDALRASASASAAAIGSAEKAVERFSDEAEELAGQLQAARSENEKNAAALSAAQSNYQKLSAQLLTAGGSAAKANERLAQLTQTLQAGGKFSLSGLLDSLSAMGSSTLTSASRSLSTIAVNAAGLKSSSAAGTLAANGLSTALTGLIKTLGGAGLGLAGVGAAAAFAGYRLYSAYQDANDGEKLWEEAYAGIPEERTTRMKNIIEAGVELKTEGLSGQVESVYQQISDALTDGEPDTTTVIAAIQEKTTGLFSSVRARIQAWYNAEMANLDLNTTAGVQKAQELTGEYDTLMDRVEALEESTAAWIAAYAGKSTEECAEALSQLQTYEDELERLAGRADELTALLQSNQKAAYTTATAGLTTDDTTVGSAAAYAQAEYSMKLSYAEEDYNTQMAALWQEYQQKIQGAASEQERLQIDAEYGVKLQEANDAYAGAQAQLEAEYTRMIAGIFQGVAEATAKTDPQLAEAIEKAVSGDFEKLNELKMNNTALTGLMKNLVETGLLEGIAGADLSTAEGQLETMVRLLAMGSRQSVDSAFGKLTLNKNSGIFQFLGTVESDFTQGISDLIQQGVVTPLNLERFFQGMDYDYQGLSGIEHLAGFMDALNAAGSAGNLDAAALEKYGAVMNDLFTILDAADKAGTEESISFLTELSAAMNALGYSTEADNVVAALRALREAWQSFEGAEPPELEPWPEMPAATDPVKVEHDLELVPKTVTLPSPEELMSAATDFPRLEHELELVPKVTLPSPEELMQSMSSAGAGASSAWALAISGGSDEAAGAAQTLAAAAQGPVTSAAAAFQSAGSNAGASFIAGMRSKLSAAAAAGTAIGSAAYNALKARLKIASPSRVAREAGGFFGEGFALGISDSITMSERSVQSLTGASVRALSPTTHNHNSNAITISLSGASIRSDEDVRMLARSLGKYITDANYGR